MPSPNAVRFFLICSCLWGFNLLYAGFDPIPADQVEAILALKGGTATVEGAVHNAFWVRNQVLMITFREERGGFVAVAFARNRPALNEAFGGDILKAVAGKTIQVTGEVTEHESRPQIVIERPDQLKVLD